MIKSAIHNTVSFQNFNRSSKFYNENLQRKEDIISPLANHYMSFEYTPSIMPDNAPSATIYYFDSNNELISNVYITDTLELASSFIYFFEIETIPSNIDHIGFKLDDYDEMIYSEKLRYVTQESLSTENIATIKAYNNDDTHGFISSNHAICGFFEFSDLDRDITIVDKTEYTYSYGRKLILSTEIYIKKRLLFIGLSMYQRGLLKFLCNCENVTIDGVQYCLVSDFTEKNKDDANEICDLQAEFVQANQSFYTTPSTETPTAIRPTNIFM